MKIRIVRLLSAVVIVAAAAVVLPSCASPPPPPPPPPPPVSCADLPAHIDDLVSNIDDINAEIVSAMYSAATILYVEYKNPVPDSVNEAAIAVVVTGLVVMSGVVVTTARAVGLAASSAFGFVTAVGDERTKFIDLGDQLDNAQDELDGARDRLLNECKPEWLDGLWQTVTWDNPGTQTYPSAKQACERQHRDFNPRAPGFAVLDTDYWWTKDCHWVPIQLGGFGNTILPGSVKFVCPIGYSLVEEVRKCQRR